MTSLPERIANLARMHGHPHCLHLIDNNLVFKKFCAAKNRRLEFPSLGCEDLNIEEEEKGGKVIFCLTLKGAGGGEKRPPYGFSDFSQKIFKLTLLEIS